MADDWRYVLYVDEAGNDGIRRRSFEGPHPQSEWFVVGGLLLRREDDANMPSAVQALLERLDMSPQGPLHFVDQSDRKRLDVCREITKLNGRWFCVASHKKNMIGFRNKLAQSVSNKENPMYNFLIRILLERVTEYCSNYNRKILSSNSSRDLKVILSERGGLAAHDVGSYLALLWTQEKEGHIYLRAKKVDFEVFSPENIRTCPNGAMFGLQLADTVVSSMFKGLPKSLDSKGRAPQSQFIKALAPSAARKDERIEGCGLTILPWRWRWDLSQDVKMFVSDLEREATGARLRDPTGSE